MKRTLSILISWAGFARVFYGGRGFGSGKAHQSHPCCWYAQAPNHSQPPNQKTTAMARKSYLSLLTLNTVALLFLCASFSAQAQPCSSPSWELAYGGENNDFLLDVEYLANSLISSCGATESFGSGGRDFAILMLDTSGNVIWERTIGGNSDDTAISLSESNDGGLLVFGTSYSFAVSGRDAFLVKLSPNGDSLWSRTYPSVTEGAVLDAYRIERYGESCRLLCSTPTNTDGVEVFLINVDGSGDTVWTRTFGMGDNNLDRGRDIVIEENGDCFVVGYSANPLTYNRAAIWKVDNTGDVVWSRNYWDNTELMSVVLTNLGNIIVAGRLVDENVNYDILLSEISGVTGDTVWTREYGYPFVDEYVSEVLFLPSGQLLCSGSQRELLTQAPFVFRLSDTGDSLCYWSEEYENSVGISSFDVTNNHVVLAGAKCAEFPCSINDGILYSLECGALTGSIHEMENFLLPDELRLQVYPNPTNGRVLVSIVGNRSPPIVRITNVLGQEVLSTEAEPFKRSGQTISLDLNELCTGVYFVQLLSGRQQQVARFQLIR